MMISAEQRRCMAAQVRLSLACAAVVVLIPAAQAHAAGPATGTSVTLGAEDDAAPWSYADGTGYANDLVRAAFEAAGWSVQLKVVPYARCKALAIAGELAGCFSTSHEQELDASLLFPQQPVFEARNLLVARTDGPLNGCDARRWGQRPTIGLVNGYEYRTEVDSLIRGGDVKVDFAGSEIATLRKVQAGYLHAGVVTVDEVKRLDYLERLAGIRSGLKVVCDFGTLPAYVAFSRRHPLGQMAKDVFDDGYSKLRERGEITSLQARWRRRALDLAAAKPH